MTCVNPWFSSPSLFSTGTRTPSKKTEPRPMMWLPTSLKRVRAMPGVSAGTISAVTPAAPLSGEPVRANTMNASAQSAKVIEVFSPSRT